MSAHGDISLAHPLPEGRGFNIVYLDDHRIFSDAIVCYCLRPYFLFDSLEVLRNGDDALQHIKNEIDQHNPIDLFITDINHPGMKGDELILKIRQYEIEKKYPYRIPIVVITMIPYAFVPGLVGAGIKMVDAYFLKAAEAEEIVEAIEGILY